MKPLMKLLLLSVPLVACGGGSNSNTTPVSQEPNTDYSRLANAKIEPGPLRQASASELSELIKNGLRVSLRDNQSYGMMVREAALINTNNTLDSKAGGSFSGTNVQVEGVDEADSVKYDGNYIYLATPTQFVEDQARTSLKIFATNAQAPSVTQISETPLDTSHWGNVSELYLVNGPQGTTNSLATIRRSWDFIAFAEKVVNDVSSDGKPLIVDEADNARSAMIWPYQMDQGIEVSLYDVRSPATPAKTWSLSIDGDLLGTRKIGDTLYVVSSFVPSIPTLDYAAETTAAKIANENLIAQAAVEKLLPEYSINGGTPQPLTGANGCMVPASTEKSDGSLRLVNITAINLASQQLVKSVCVNASVEGIYSSADNLYLGGSDYNRWESWQSYSVIHQFALGKGTIDYTATGAVDGVLGWSNPSFRMDEHQGHLRVLTTNYQSEQGPIHQLQVLKKVNGRSELELVAQLPNKNRPEAIGKPNEDIFGVRFNGEKAYVVTFERKDPLYVLDLANPADPAIAGQLEIPGFSTYLHPVGDDYLFALGNETNREGFASGVKVSLYDIRNPTAPTEVSKWVFGNSFSWSSALYDHHALSFLQASSDQLRITLPISLYEAVELPEFTSSRWLSEGLYQFEINGLNSGKASLDHKGTLISEDASTQEYPLWSGTSRSFLHDQALFYVHGDTVIAAPWSTAK